MRDPARIERILTNLRPVWEKRPDWRLGQLLSNLGGLGPQDLFHLQDEELERLISLQMEHSTEEQDSTTVEEV